MSGTGWIGVDLDGTLAEYHGWRGIEHIGTPIPAMVARVQAWLLAGREVRIFTARCVEPEAVPHIEAWCLEHVGQVLPVTNVKDYGMVALYDDRAYHVLPNTGAVIEPAFTVPAHDPR